MFLSCESFISSLKRCCSKEQDSGIRVSVIVQYFSTGEVDCLPEYAPKIIFRWLYL